MAYKYPYYYFDPKLNRKIWFKTIEEARDYRNKINFIQTSRVCMYESGTDKLVH